MPKIPETAEDSELSNLARGSVGDDQSNSRATLTPPRGSAPGSAGSITPQSPIESATENRLNREPENQPTRNPPQPTRSDIDVPKKRPRTAFTPEQIKRLEGEFAKNKYLSVAKRMELSKALNLTETQVCCLYCYFSVNGRI